MLFDPLGKDVLHGKVSFIINLGRLCSLSTVVLKGFNVEFVEPSVWLDRVD